jgi:hypothetical protein
MSNFAHVAGGTVIEFYTPPADVPMSSIWPSSMTWVDVTSVMPVPQVGWDAVQTNGAWTFTAPAASPGPTLAAQAQAALDRSDMTSTRCFKAGVPFPADWQTYCVALRAIVGGTAGPMPTTLPAQPAYPAGT